MPANLHDDEDEMKEAAQASASARFKDFDCPTCNANNPCDPPIGAEDEVLCNYCGSEFMVRVSDGGRLKLKER
jgi:ribosomal protein S27E